MSAVPSSSSAAAPGTPVPPLEIGRADVQRVLGSLGQLADDGSVPRNVRRVAQSAKEELLKKSPALDVRIASAVYLLDELANDPNLPTHGRTAIWSIISGLESLQ